MGSNYTSLIALIVAVFFAGIYFRGERARKAEIEREIVALSERQAEINAVVTDIVRLAARKDSVFRARIDSAWADIALLDDAAVNVRERIDSLGQQIVMLDVDLEAQFRRITEMGAFTFATTRIHSVSVDPDIAPSDSIDFNPIEVFVARPLRDSLFIASARIDSLLSANDVSRPVRDALLAMKDSLQVADSLAHPQPAHMLVARRFVGVTERPKNSNRGPEVESFLEAVGLKATKDRFGNWKSYPYCAAFVSYVLNETDSQNPEGRGTVAVPRVRSAMARAFVTQESVEARLVQRGAVKIAPGTIVVWKANRDPQDASGHVGFVVDWEGQAGTTIEGNTGPGDAGSQRDGDGVYLRKRMLSPGSYFRITHFTPVKYAGENTTK